MCIYSKNAYHHFPKGTIHLIGVDAGKKMKEKILSQKLMAIILLDLIMEFFSLIFQNKKTRICI